MAMGFDDRYDIHGGPMAGRANYQKADYQCVRPGEIWTISWLEETGTIITIVYDIPNAKITTTLGFSKGHWTCPQDAHGDKRNPEDFQRWRALADIGRQTDRHILYDQADIKETYKGAGKLQDIDLGAPTI